MDTALEADARQLRNSLTWSTTVVSWPPLRRTGAMHLDHVAQYAGRVVAIGQFPQPAAVPASIVSSESIQKSHGR